MGRVGLIMAALAFVTVALASLIPLVGVFLVAPLTAAIVGAGAGWWASKALGYGTAGRGAGAGAIAGIGALIGSVVGLAILAGIVGNSAQFQQQLNQVLRDAQQQNPGTAVPNINAGALATVGGIIGGFCFGLFDLFLSVIGGLIAGVVYGRNRGSAMPVPSAGYPTGGTGLPHMTNTPENNEEHGARIYREK
jgi:hypothetical protein